MLDVTASSDAAEDAVRWDAAQTQAGDLNLRLQRADGKATLVVGSSTQGTRIEELFQRAPLRIMFARGGGNPIEEAVYINTAGGIAGGDRLESAVTALVDASVALTSQAAEKVYRSLGEPARIATHLTVHAGARLAWLPQETIIFNAARLVRETEIDLCPSAELLALESLVLGRAAHGEEMTAGHISEGWRVRIDGRLVWADQFHASGEVFSQLRRKALLGNCKAVATLLYFGRRPESRLAFFRDIMPSLECECGATSIGGLIVVRLAASRSFELKLALRSILTHLNVELGAGPFRVPKMWSC